MPQLLPLFTQVHDNKRITDNLKNIPVKVSNYWFIIPEHRWIGVCNEGNHPP